jgi:hypothetical protein
MMQNLCATNRYGYTTAVFPGAEAGGQFLLVDIRVIFAHKSKKNSKYSSFLIFAVEFPVLSAQNFAYFIHANSRGKAIACATKELKISLCA